ncbi:hypothetical protein [Ornithinibacillus halophilus]|uniref:hypothetical protein n=1 Tax=Ornithinibacillus halophilus TaxID=930117 RepID=UPI0011607B29|nr:hypothetical protein [Ornithinibacillus halophilus]
MPKLVKEIHVDSCGSRGIGETPESFARGGSPAARGKRSVFSVAVEISPPPNICSHFQKNRTILLFGFWYI